MSKTACFALGFIIPMYMFLGIGMVFPALPVLITGVDVLIFLVPTQLFLSALFALIFADKCYTEVDDQRN